MSDPAYLIIRTAAPHIRFQRFCAANRQHGGILVAARAIHEIETLEPGSIPLHTWIALFPSMDSAKAAWTRMDTSMLAAPAPPLALAARAVPDGGFEDDVIPTRTNVTPGPDQPPTLMLIEGTATDETAMDLYRGVILPMLKARGAYYVLFELGGDIAVLSGDWDDAVFLISRWPSAHAARDFWLADRYQDTAIPLRLGASAFQVVTLEGERDDG